MFYRRYVDDIFVLSESTKSEHSFREYMSSKHQNIKFTVEQENIGSLSFLDIKICRKNGKFVTSVYRKPTFRGVFTNYESFIPAYQKRGLSHILLHRSFSIYCDFKIFHFEIDYLKTIFTKNNYPPNFIASCIKLFYKSCIHLKLGMIHTWRPWKLSNFRNPPPPVHLRPKFFHPLDLGRQISNEAPLSKW